MPQIYDMGPTALLPLRRKACWRFFIINICSVNIVDDAIIEVATIVVFVYFREDTEKTTLNSAKKETEFSALRVRSVDLG